MSEKRFSSFETDLYIRITPINISLSFWTGLDLNIFLDRSKEQKKPIHVYTMYIFVIVLPEASKDAEAIQSWNHPLHSGTQQRIMCVCACIVPLPLPRADPQLVGARSPALFHTAILQVAVPWSE